MDTFSKGMQVYFDGPNGRVDGKVIRVNKKTVSVDPGTGEGYYRVPPSVLHAVDKMSDMLSSCKLAVLSVSQDQIFQCLQPDRDKDDLTRLERIAAVVTNPQGLLIVVADSEDVERGLTHGWETLAILLQSNSSTLAMAGRIGLVVEGFEDDPRALFQIPKVRTWLVHLQTRLPWLGAWLEAETGTAFQLVGALAPWQIKAGEPIMGQEQLQAAVHIANFAVGFTRMLGGSELDHVEAFLAFLGLRNLPDGFFADAEQLASQLDPAGRVRRD